IGRVLVARWIGAAYVIGVALAISETTDRRAVCGPARCRERQGHRVVRHARRRIPACGWFIGGERQSRSRRARRERTRRLPVATGGCRCVRGRPTADRSV